MNFVLRVGGWSRRQAGISAVQGGRRCKRCGILAAYVRVCIIVRIGHGLLQRRCSWEEAVGVVRATRERFVGTQMRRGFERGLEQCVCVWLWVGHCVDLQAARCTSPRANPRVVPSLSWRQRCEGRWRWRLELRQSYRFSPPCPARAQPRGVDALRYAMLALRVFARCFGQVGIREHR